MARGRRGSINGPDAKDQSEPLTWGFVVERVMVRVMGIEPALSAWEAQRLRLSGALTRRP
jgi:hypothetical protein